MLNGIIFVKESIISLHLQSLLSKYYKIVNVFRNIKDAPLDLSGVDFLIIDTDPYSEQELRNILQKLNLRQDVKIISITSYSPKISSYTYKHKELLKPFTNSGMLEAINLG